MRFEDIKNTLTARWGENVLFQSTRPELHRFLYDFVIEHQSKNCLELGSAHGISACFIAAALDENEKGHLTAIDRRAVLEKGPPTAEESLKTAGLTKYVTPVLAETSYNWELMRIIETNTVNHVCTSMFDFCFIDGAHTWETDGLAFFLITKLLKPNGWLILDDLNWSFNKSPTLKNKEFVQRMPEEQKETPQIKKIWELLVKQSPAFKNFTIDEPIGAAYCQKI